VRRPGFIILRPAGNEARLHLPLRNSTGMWRLRSLRPEPWNFPVSGPAEDRCAAGPRARIFALGWSSPRGPDVVPVGKGSPPLSEWPASRSRDRPSFPLSHVDDGCARFYDLPRHADVEARPRECPRLRLAILLELFNSRARRDQRNPVERPRYARRFAQRVSPSSQFQRDLR
jgi:hypothetical protein